MDAPTALVWFTDAEVAAMLRAAPGLWWRAFVELAVVSGLRVGELLRLHWSDLDRKTLSVRVTSERVPCTDDTDGVNLRAAIPPHRERFVSIEARVFTALDSLRADRREDTHVFVPEWMLDRLWTRTVAGERLRADTLAPRIGEAFKGVQRLARHALASDLNLPLDRVPWRQRPLAALRNTYAHRATQRVSPTTLMELLGYASVRPILRYYDHIPARMAGGVP